jgi:hypothetical protein
MGMVERLHPKRMATIPFKEKVSFGCFLEAKDEP